MIKNFLLATLLLSPGWCRAQEPQLFPTPEAAVEALTKAAKARDCQALRAMFGDKMHDMINPEFVRHHHAFRMFVRRLEAKVKLEPKGDSQVELRMGADAWLFPVPLVKKGGSWFFDGEAGSEEILNRRIGADELGAMAVCRAYVQAQHEYIAKTRKGADAPQYAQRLRSSPGKQDGLYWPAARRKESSPLGPLISESRREGHWGRRHTLTDGQTPYHGYYFRILTRQGSHAVGGSYDYVIKGRMVAGFALLAWPAQWGKTGVMTFEVSAAGKVYEKDLGPKTESLAADLSAYDPDDTWKPAQD